MDLTITAQAEKFISRMVRFGGMGPDAGFRLSVSPGGCSGLSAEFTVEAEPLPGDAVVETNGIRLFLPAESRVLLQGVTVDFQETPLSSGFKFHNPNSTGCGTCSSSSTASTPGSVAVVTNIEVRKPH